MVAIDPSLGDRDIIQIRESMVKFESDGRTLEIIQTSKPGRFGYSTILIRVGIQQFWKALMPCVAGTVVNSYQINGIQEWARHLCPIRCLAVI